MNRQDVTLSSSPENDDSWVSFLTEGMWETLLSE